MRSGCFLSDDSEEFGGVFFGEYAGDRGFALKGNAGVYQNGREMQFSFSVHFIQGHLTTDAKKGAFVCVCVCCFSVL